MLSFIKLLIVNQFLLTSSLTESRKCLIQVDYVANKKTFWESRMRDLRVGVYMHL